MIGPGNFLLELWDNRANSPTRNNYYRIKAGRDNPALIIVPPGVVHGYTNISDHESGMVINYPNRLYRGEGKKEEVDETRHEEDRHSPFQLCTEIGPRRKGSQQ